MGYAHFNVDNGWLAGGLVRGYGATCCSSVRLYNKAVPDVSGWKELVANACCDKAGVWCRPELIQPQSVWVKLSSWGTGVTAEWFWLD
jgi:hypothetical protein